MVSDQRGQQLRRMSALPPIAPRISAAQGSSSIEEVIGIETGVAVFDCGGHAMVGGTVPDIASMTWDIIRRIRKNTAKAAAEPA